VLRELPEGHYTECTQCGGIWLDSQSFERVMEDKDSSALGKIVPKAGGQKGREVERQKVAYVPCPVCRNLMHRKNFAGCSGVVIDWCKGHGFWFDTDELEKVIAFIHSGGLDKSRKLEIERARSEIDRLRAQKKATAAAAPAMGWGFEPRPEPDWGFDLGEAFSTLLRRFF
jgi:Zn-finger nucleic acid-binding protein